LGKPERGLVDCNEGLRASPDHGEMLDSRGFAYLKLKLYDPAIADYTAALKLMPSKAASLYGRGLARRAMGDTEGGDADIAAALKIRPEIEGDFRRWGAASP
jgi:tetratricopeptide (TPR) repeat protein